MNVIKAEVVFCQLGGGARQVLFIYIWLFLEILYFILNLFFDMKKKIK